MKFLCKPDPGIGSFLKLSDQPVIGCKADFWLVLAHPRKICSWVEITSPSGEEVGWWVTIPCILHYKMHKPEKDGLICQGIFGPVESIKGLKIGSNILDCMDHEPSISDIGKTIFCCTDRTSHGFNIQNYKWHWRHATRQPRNGESITFLKSLMKKKSTSWLELRHKTEEVGPFSFKKSVLLYTSKTLKLFHENENI